MSNARVRDEQRLLIGHCTELLVTGTRVGFRIEAHFDCFAASVIIQMFGQLFKVDSY